MQNTDFEYAGFWLRVAASIIDTILLSIVIFPPLTAIYGAAYWSSTELIQGPADFLISWVAPAFAIVLFWMYKQATPGKMLTSIKIVDAKTGGKPSTPQLVGRYLAYYVAMLPLCLGFIWVGFDARKQGWHDKLAGTLVVREKSVA